MRLSLLASGTGWHVRDLRRAAKERDLKLELCDWTTLQESIPQNLPRERDAILVRAMPAGSLEQVIFRMDTLLAAHSTGTQIFNSPRALECCIDKYLTSQKLSQAGLPTPRTWCGQTTSQALTAFEELDRDVIIKPLFGSEGRGMVRVSDVDTAWRVCQAIEAVGGVLYVQEFVDHGGNDTRAFVIGGHVVASMNRLSDSWRTNVAQGGRVVKCELPPKERQLAIDAARAVGADIAGVDLVNGPNGWIILEVNGCPGWRALSSVCGFDVASAMIEFIRGRVGK